MSTQATLFLLGVARGMVVLDKPPATIGGSGYRQARFHKYAPVGSVASFNSFICAGNARVRKS